LSDLIESVGFFPFSGIIYILTFSLSIEKFTFFEKILNPDDTTALFKKFTSIHRTPHRIFTQNPDVARNMPTTPLSCIMLKRKTAYNGKSENASFGTVSVIYVCASNRKHEFTSPTGHNTISNPLGIKDLQLLPVGCI